jgi:hypothetical protein
MEVLEDYLPNGAFFWEGNRVESMFDGGKSDGNGGVY